MPPRFTSAKARARKAEARARATAATEQAPVAPRSVAPAVAAFTPFQGVGNELGFAQADNVGAESVEAARPTTRSGRTIQQPNRAEYEVVRACRVRVRNRASQTGESRLVLSRIAGDPSSPGGIDGTGTVFDPTGYQVKLMRVGEVTYQMADMDGNVLDDGRFHNLADITNSEYQEAVRNHAVGYGYEFHPDVHAEHPWTVPSTEFVPRRV